MKDETTYEPRYVELEGGWRHRVLCEEEWLARPDFLPLGLVPENIQHRKEWYYFHPMIRRNLDRLKCICAKTAIEFWERGNTDWMKDERLPSEQWNTLRLAGYGFRIACEQCPQGRTCPAFLFLRDFSMYYRGVISLPEWKNRLYESSGSWIFFNPPEIDATTVFTMQRDTLPFSRALLRDIFGNPYRPVTIDRTLFQWRESTIPRLAETIRNQRDFQLLPILADALEEAGCKDRSILAHCRQTDGHFEGCWVIEAILDAWRI